eukprot:scaffold1315_cov405-Prasinococcus_capsulatus_cf.AAC.14
MAKKEGNVEVIAQIQKCMDAAMAEKTATLRPEIQLLNLLVNADEERIEELLRDARHQETLKRDNGYFFQLVKKMYQDVKKQNGNPQQKKLMKQLREVEKLYTGEHPSPRGLYVGLPSRDPSPASRGVSALASHAGVGAPASPAACSSCPPGGMLSVAVCIALCLSRSPWTAMADKKVASMHTAINTVAGRITRCDRGVPSGHCPFLMSAPSTNVFRTPAQLPKSMSTPAECSSGMGNVNSAASSNPMGIMGTSSDPAAPLKSWLADAIRGGSSTPCADLPVTANMATSWGYWLGRRKAIRQNTAAVPRPMVALNVVL